MTKSPLRNRLHPQVRLRFPGFEKQRRLEERAGHEPVMAYHFDPIDATVWYREFADRIIDAVDEATYLPLYRMGDGEFSFALDTPHDEKVPFRELTWKGKLSLLLKYAMGQGGEHRTVYGENYSVHERQVAHDTFVEGVRHIAREGILCATFHASPLFKHYFPEIFDWLDRECIDVNRSNYMHMYAVYALMHGPDASRLLSGRHVLVVTSLTETKKQQIRKGLRNRGVERTQFLEISKHKAMLDNVDASAVTDVPDLALLAAGVGACNIIQQLSDLRIPQLDVGFCIDTIINPDLRWKRPFCVPDDDFDPDRIEYL